MSPKSKIETNGFMQELKFNTIGYEYTGNAKAVILIQSSDEKLVRYADRYRQEHFKGMAVDLMICPDERIRNMMYQKLQAKLGLENAVICSIQD